MEKRQQQLYKLKLFTEKLDNDITMILQSLQWDRKHLLEGTAMVTCKYNCSHRIPPDKQEAHEQKCFLACHGYDKDDILLPDPVDPSANTVVTLNNNAIAKIIGEASKLDPLFKKGTGAPAPGPQPQSLARLQATYTPDERRAIHDAVVQAAPFCHDLADLALPSDDAQKSSKSKSRVEILAELRDMKRRRTKYRVAAKTKNYSDVLRDVIKTQMDMYTEVKSTSLNKLHEPEIKVEPSSEDTADTNHRNNSTTSTSYWRQFDYSIDKGRLREETPLLDEPKLKDKVIEEYRRNRSNESRREVTKDRYSRRRSRSRDRSRYHTDERDGSSTSRKYNDNRHDRHKREREDDKYTKYDRPSGSRDRERSRDSGMRKYRDYENSVKDGKCIRKYVRDKEEDSNKRKKYS